MQDTYDEIISFMLESGRRIAPKSGKIKDIGLAKQYLTEEDLAIERGFKEIVKKSQPDHEFYAEEEHDSYPNSDNVWISDPISGTKFFIEGTDHFGIVIAHLCKGEVIFGAVYDPKYDELYVAYKNKGAFLNGQKLEFSKNPKPNILFNYSAGWKDKASAQEIKELLREYKYSRNKGSHGVSLCHLARGDYNGVVCLCKDTFPYYAGSLIIKEAGGILTNLDGNENIKHYERVFIGGNKETQKLLLDLIKKVSLPKFEDS